MVDAGKSSRYYGGVFTYFDREGLSPEFEELKTHGALHSVSESAGNDYFDRWYLGHFTGDM